VKSVLVVYGTTDGHTARVAGSLATTLRHEGCLVDLTEATDAMLVSPRAYDAVIVAASLHAGGYQKPVMRWVRHNSRDLAGRPTAFVSVCLAVLENSPKTRHQIDRILMEFQYSVRWSPDEVKIVAGALPYTRYGWLKKRVMRRIVRKAGGDTDITRDFEYTDWNDLGSFVREFARGHGLLSQPADRSPALAGYTHEQSDY
jgi:menaquinone-dependent protoporphyrinogen oxidase